MPIHIPIEALEPETLLRMLQDFVTRDGTDYGEVETALETKIQQVRSALEKGHAVIVFDESSETFTILPKEEAKAL
jgi:uncharacterized protein